MTNHSENAKTATCDNNVLANRLYEFRGVNKSNNEIIYGNYYFDGKYHFIDKCFEHRKEVYAKSVSQFTGLKDIEGKKIYEGDVLELNNCGLLIVCFYKGEFKLQKLAEYHKKRNLYASISYLEFSVLRGNIYENPNLLQ